MTNNKQLVDPYLQLEYLKKDIKTKNHKLLLSAGYISQIGLGSYGLLPLGLTFKKNIENIIRCHLDAIADEVYLPIMLPVTLLHDSDRYHDFMDNKSLVHHDNQYYFAPTHEEAATKLFKTLIKSDTQLPMVIYQIQPKFRNELRVKGGLMRTREFWMKDAYAITRSPEETKNMYNLFRLTYQKIMDDLQLDAVFVKADHSSMQGNYSEELHIISDIGEDIIAIDTDNNHAFNLEIAPNASIKDVLLVKTITLDHNVTCIIGLEDQLNFNKLKQVLSNSYSPKYIIDQRVNEQMTTITINEQEMLLSELIINNNTITADITEVKNGYNTPHGGTYRLFKSIEVGHIFDLGFYYSNKFNLTSSDGKPLSMSCYGLGITRLMSVLIEKHSHDKAISLPAKLRPFDLAIISRLSKDLVTNLVNSVIKPKIVNFKITSLILTNNHNIKINLDYAKKIGCKAAIIIKSLNSFTSYTLVDLELNTEFHSNSLFDNSLVELVVNLIK